MYANAENLRDDMMVAMQVLGNPRQNNGYLGSSEDGFIINALDISAVEVLEIEEEEPETTPEDNPGED